MKIDRLVRFCDSDLKAYASKRVCVDCNHDIECPGSCGECIDQVHLSRRENERQDYNCPYMIKYYVCRYIYAYTSEIEDCLEIIRDKVIALEHIHMLSIGSGASPDLYALWRFHNKTGYSKPISYIGFEHNEYWKEINEKTKDIFLNTNFRIQYFYEDALETFKCRNISRTNILVLQYVLSHIVYNGRENEIYDFFNNLVEKVILKMESNAFVIINDINHYLARDKFKILENVIENHGKNIRVHKYYYLFKNLNCYQRDGIEHSSNNINYTIDSKISSYYDTRSDCRSVQHIIEVF